MSYEEYIKEYMVQEKRPELVGGRNLRLYGGSSAVLSLRKSQIEISGDE